MKSQRAIFLSAIAWLALVPWAGAGPAWAGQDQGSVEIKMTAKRYEFNPKVITVNKGDRVKLIITALDRDHGFELDEFGINQRLKKGDPTIIEFTASKAGAFPFHCSVFCGLGHHRMKGKLNVKDAGGNYR